MILLLKWHFHVWLILVDLPHIYTCLLPFSLSPVSIPTAFPHSSFYLPVTCPIAFPTYCLKASIFHLYRVFSDLLVCTHTQPYVNMHVNIKGQDPHVRENIIFSRSICVPTNLIIYFLYEWIEFHCVYVLCFITHSSVDVTLFPCCCK